MLQIWFFQVSQSKMHQKAADAAKKLGADVTLGLDFDKLGQKLRKLEKCQIRRSSMQKKQIN